MVLLSKMAICDVIMVKNSVKIQSMRGKIIFGSTCMGVVAIKLLFAASSDIHGAVKEV